jgi:hypothetical protein
MIQHQRGLGQIMADVTNAETQDLPYLDKKYFRIALRTGMGISLHRTAQLAFSSRDRLGKAALLASLASVCLLAIGISQRPLVAGDTYHVLACQMVAAGRLPHVDFFIQQAPLYPLVCGMWMRIFGSSWQAANLLSALLVCGSATILAGIARQIYSESTWETKGSIVVLLFFGLNFQVVEYGEIAQPFALCIFFSLLACLAAFASTPIRIRFFASGLAAGAALNTTLLALPFLLILTAWSVFHVVRPDRLRAFLFLCCGAALASMPLGYLAILAPSQTWFGMIEFHLFHRADQWFQAPRPWTSITQHNLHEIMRWTTSIQGVLLVFLSLAGLPFLFDRNTRIATRYLQLAALVVLGWCSFLSLPRPTFYIYYVLVAPYLCILASAGLWAMTTRMWSVSWAPILLASTMLLYSLEVPMGMWSDYHLYWPGLWADHEKIAQQINTVTSPDDPVYATDESVYVAARRLPPRGLENSFGTALRLLPEEYVRSGLVPHDRIETQLLSGQFAAVVLFKPRNLTKIELLRRKRLYSQYTETDRYVMFWKPKMLPEKDL